MLYKLRNNVFASPAKDRNESIFTKFRISFMSDFTYAESLSHNAQELSTIVEKISGKKEDNTVDMVIIEDTLKILKEQGFIISGNTEEELSKKEMTLNKNISVK